MEVWPGCMSLHHVLVRCLWSPEEGIRSLVTDDCESSCGCWELNTRPLEEQPVLLITKSSPQPHFFLM